MSLLFYYLMPIMLLAGMYDYYWRRIPNAITLPMAGLGIILQTFVGAGLIHGLLGLLIGGGFFFLCYLLGIMGAGDVKLMAAVSTWLYIHTIVEVLMLTIFAGGFLAVWMMIWQRMSNSTGGQTSVVARTLSIPYGVAIATGTVLSLFIIS